MKQGGTAAILLLLLALTVALGGCGSDSGTSDSLTKAELEKQAEVVCNSYESEKEETIVKLQQQFQGNPSPKQQEEIILTILGPYEQMIEGLKELNGPAGEEQKIEVATDAMEAALKKAKSDPESVLKSTAPFDKANEQAESAGLDNCRV